MSGVRSQKSDVKSYLASIGYVYLYLNERGSAILQNTEFTSSAFSHDNTWTRVLLEVGKKILVFGKML